MPAKATFAVYENTGTAFVMACVCTCGAPAVAFSDDAYGLFAGTCREGHDAAIMAS